MARQPVRRSSRAGRTGRSWYGSYEVRYQDAAGEIRRYDATNRRRAERAVRRLVAEGAAWAEVRDDRNEGPILRVVSSTMRE